VGALGIYPSVETLLGQGILLALAVYALWRTLLVGTEDAAPAPAAEVTDSPSDPAPSEANSAV
jgi:hypothetical protein